jgi:hypothetical protein
VQVGQGADVRLLDREMLKEKFPWLNVEDVVLGSYGGECVVRKSVFLGGVVVVMQYRY